jgi:23S rRNA pseudouridine1911/1915/1917 synthase
MSALDPQHTISVPDACAGMPVRRFVGDVFPLESEQVIRALFSASGVRIDGTPCPAHRTLREGMSVQVAGLDAVRRKTKVDIVPADVIYEDDHILVLNKPSGCTVTPERGTTSCGFREGILAWLRTSPHAEHIRAARYRPRLIHRLDRDTSGAIMAAISRRGELELARQLQQRTLEKEYLAVVHGELTDEDGDIDLPVGSDRKDISRMRIDLRAGKPAVTRYRIAECFRSFSLLKVWPRTGRRHQIRLHLAERGHPVVSDALYGGTAPLLSRIKRDYRPKRRRAEKPLIARPALHAHALTLAPVGASDPLRIEAPLPKDLRVLLKMLRKYARGGAASGQ